MSNLSFTFNALDSARPLSSSLAVGPANDSGESPTALLEALAAMDLLAKGDVPTIMPIGTGGSSEIFRVDLGWGTFCIKRALPRIKFAADALIPIERSNFECEWLRLARDVLGEAVPAVIGERPGLFAMDYLDPQRHASWAEQLRHGDINPSTAAEVGRIIGRMHAATANNFAVAQRFATDRIFHVSRIEPLLLATAELQPSVAPQLQQLALSTRRTRLALIHGDFSPNNVLIGPKGPVLLDAECAWYGDPAFDVAHCLSFLLVNCVLQPQWRDYYLTSYSALCTAYLQRVTWEMPEQTDERAALLLPALVLSHAYGRVPIESLQREDNKERIGILARQLLNEPLVRLSAVREAWRRAMSPA